MMKAYQGIGVSLGVAIGKVYLIDRNRISVSRNSITENDIPAEIARFKRAVATSKDQLGDIRKEGRDVIR